MIKRTFRLGTLLLATLALSSCGERLTPEDALNDAIAANDRTDRFDIHIDTVQKIDMEGSSIKQSAVIDVNLIHDPIEVYFDASIKNPLATMDISYYRESDSYYMKYSEAGEDWMEIDDPEATALLGDSMMMDYDKPSVYLNLLLGDDNRMTAREKANEITISVDEPTEKTRRAIAKYLIDSINQNQGEGEVKMDPTTIEISHLVITFDSDTSLVQSISMDQNIRFSYGDGTDTVVDQTINVTYDNYGVTEINLPSDLTELIEENE